MATAQDPASLAITQLPPELAGHQVTKLTGKQLKDAAEDAQFIMAESASVRGLVLAMIITRRVYMLLDRALRVDIEESWDMANPALVMHTLAASAERKALEPITVAALDAMVHEVLLPILTMYSAVERDAANGNSVSGRDNGCETGLGDNLRPVQGDEDVKSRVNGEGDRREDGAAPG